MPTLVYEGVQRFGRLRRVGDVFAHGVMPLRRSSAERFGYALVGEAVDAA